MTLFLVHRVCPASGHKVRPFFHDDKLSLHNLCLTTMRRSLRRIDTDIELHILFDNCPPEYERAVHTIFSKESRVRLILHTDNQIHGNYPTFLEQIRIANMLRLRPLDRVYFSEDDYFYCENAFPFLLDCLATKKAEFVTLYDHPDRYTRSDDTFQRTPLLHLGDHYARYHESTCLTFGCSVTGLSRVTRHARRYKQGDRALWRGILWWKRYNLAGPVPSLATHMESAFLPFLVDWPSEFARGLTELKNVNSSPLEQVVGNHAALG